MILCTLCENLKKKSEFRTHSLNRKSGRCKDCDRKRDRAYYARNKKRECEKQHRHYRKNKEKALARSRRWRKNNPGYTNAWQKQWAMKNPKAYKKWARKNRYQSRYGLSQEDIKQMIKVQKNKCAICKKRPKGKKLVVDHNHKTNKVRAMLCHWCNVGLGNLGDNIRNLKNAISYLRNHS